MVQALVAGLVALPMLFRRHILRVVDRVGDRAVIVVMSDHGSRPYGSDDLTPSEIESQFSILLASRTPSGEALFEDDALVTDVISPVANHYLGTDIPPLDRILEGKDGRRYPE